MCGIAAIISKSDIDYNIQPLLSEIDHRGPDNNGVFYWQNKSIFYNNLTPEFEYRVALGHKRLSIIDLSEAASQPFCSDDKQWWLSYNGEVYNYLEIKQQLVNEGVNFHTTSDTEVILKSIIHWGLDNAIRRFQGMFAFVLLNTNTDEVFVARDPFGIKPLYFTSFDNNTWVFGSEIKMFKTIPWIDVSLDYQEVFRYLLRGGIDYGDKTLFNKINQFLPGTWGKIDLKQETPTLETTTYWHPEQVQKIEISFDEAVDKTRELFLKNIKMHLRSDVSVGVALSGGLDSSAIVCCIRQLYPDMPIHTFSFVPDDAALTEENYADIVNKHVGAIAHKVRINKHDIVNDFADLIKYQDQPFGSLAIYSQFRVFKAASQAGIKVMLDGQGADELMGGYAPLQGYRLSSMLRKGQLNNAIKFVLNQKKWSDRTAKSVMLTGANQFLSVNGRDISGFLKKQKLPAWLNLKYFDKRITHKNDYLSKGPNYLNAVLKISVSRGLMSLLRYEDRNSMAHSIESRVPFLTTEFAEFVLSLPEEYMIDVNGGSKVIFRQAMRGIVPDEILDRKEKKGFATPDFDWVNANYEYFSKLVNEAGGVECLNIQEAKKELLHKMKQKKDFSVETWRLLNFVSWLKLSNK